MVAEYVEHYHTERNHQSLANELIGASIPANTDGVVRRRERIGGLRSYYYARPHEYGAFEFWLRQEKPG